MASAAGDDYTLSTVGYAWSNSATITLANDGDELVLLADEGPASAVNIIVSASAGSEVTITGKAGVTYNNIYITMTNANITLNIKDLDIAAPNSCHGITFYNTGIINAAGKCAVQGGANGRYVGIYSFAGLIINAQASAKLSITGTSGIYMSAGDLNFTGDGNIDITARSLSESNGVYSNNGNFTISNTGKVTITGGDYEFNCSGVRLDNGDFTLKDCGTVYITGGDGATGGSSGCHVYGNVIIDGGEDIKFTGGDGNLVAGNGIQANDNNAHIEIKKGNVTTIGGNTTDPTNATGGCGINSNCALIISGGYLDAKGNGRGGHGITVDTITISGSDTDVTAAGSGSGAAISTSGNLTIEDNATVTATGGDGDIGGNAIYSNGNAIFSNSTVTATGGKGLLDSGGRGIDARRNVSVTGATLVATGGVGRTRGGDAIYTDEGNLNMTGGTLSSFGGDGASGNGGMAISTGGKIHISGEGTSVTALGGNSTISGNGGPALDSYTEDIEISSGASITAIGGDAASGNGGLGMRARTAGKAVTIASNAGDVYIRGGMGSEASGQRASIMARDVYIATGNVGVIEKESSAAEVTIKNILNGDNVHMLTVYTDPAEETVISSDVTGSLAGTYTYKAPTQADGVAYMWLPAGEQTVSAPGYFDDSGIVNTNNDAVITLAKTPVIWTGLTANGTSNATTTTELTLTFDIGPMMLTADDITVTGAVKGALTGTGTTRTLSILNITVANGESITVEIANPTGYAITPASQTVVVYKASSSGGGSSTTYYTVKFNTNGGNAVSDKSVAYGNTVTKPADPTRDGYTFTGWYTDEACTALYDFSVKVTKSFTLYAGWEKTETPVDSDLFDDISGHWAESYINSLGAHGYVNGTGNRMFSPNAPLTRAQFVQIIYNAFGNGDDSSPIVPFDDCDSGAWYAKALNWAYANGIINGYSSTMFGPGDHITREQMAVLIVRAAEKFEVTFPSTNDRKAFDDDSLIASYAKDAVYTMQQADIISGKPGNIFDPNGSATRGEMAKVMYFVLDYAGKIADEYKVV